LHIGHIERPFCIEISFGHLSVSADKNDPKISPIQNDKTTIM